MVHVVGVCTENIDVTHKGFCENVEVRDWYANKYFPYEKMCA